MLDALILAILVLLAVAAVKERDLLGATAITGVYSLMMALLWVRMNAVDVAYTEAAVGAGISTVLMLAALARVGRQERPPRADAPRAPLPMPLLACLLTGAALVYGTLDMPRVGDPGAPANIHPDLVIRFLASADRADGSLGEVGPLNTVTSVLGDYRGYDTLGETTVIFTAALCVSLLLRHAPRAPSPAASMPASADVVTAPRRRRRGGTP